jgi:hypothetical protein
MTNNETQHLTDEAVAERQAAEDRVLARYQAEAERQADEAGLIDGEPWENWAHERAVREVWGSYEAREAALA